jgi:hypothetical protein
MQFCRWWGLAGVCRRLSRFCVGAFGRDVALVAVKMFSHLIDFVKKFCKCCAFDAICKVDAAINCITVQHKDRSIPVSFDLSYYTLVTKIVIR